MDAQPNVPKVLVAAVIMNTDGLVLLVQHAPYWKWHLPDGEVRFGERLEETMLSAFHADFGLSLRVLDTHAWFVTEAVSEARQMHFLTLHFRAEVVGGASLVIDREGLQILWGDPTAVMGMSSEHMLRSTSAALQKVADDAEPE